MIKGDVLSLLLDHKPKTDDKEKHTHTHYECCFPLRDDPAIVRRFTVTGDGTEPPVSLLFTLTSI